ncbi:uncharacterized protein LOC118919389 isoform X2 [Manis pentadactyla]|uniref:uncharacterized protein LOC118919389 isoform X2 n=1 Tax=Manis pentadactyla TaxID=143292 RepID=UPI00255C3EC0|nr:uncharacterized protein LOC118919389 isoform X2 [Manis pentadactyla]
MTELPPRHHYKAGCLDWGQATVTLSPQPLWLLSTPSVPHSPAMTSYSRVALVTGANRGIGLAIVRSLCQQFPGDVVLTARDAAQGHAAVQQLQAEGLSPRFHLLDICNRQSIRALRDFLLKEYGGLDVLINNAGIAIKDDRTSLHLQAEMTMKTNFFCTRDVCTELLPLVRPQGPGAPLPGLHTYQWPSVLLSVAQPPLPLLGLFSPAVPQALHLLPAPHACRSLSMASRPLPSPPVSSVILFQQTQPSPPPIYYAFQNPVSCLELIQIL